MCADSRRTMRKAIENSVFSLSGTSQMDLNSAVRRLAPGATWKDENYSIFSDVTTTLWDLSEIFEPGTRGTRDGDLKRMSPKRSTPTFDYINRRKNVSTQKAMQRTRTAADPAGTLRSERIVSLGPELGSIQIR